VPTPSKQWLVCDVGSRRCAIPAADAIETMRPLPCERIAGAPEFVLGVAIVRGAPVPVVDAAALVGAERDRVTRFVSVRCGKRRIVLAVDGVLGVSELPEGALADSGSMLGDASPDVITAIGTLDSRLLLVLESTRLVPEPVWEFFERTRGPT
jgi:purine-binding chemotaxis protein CheW